VFTRPAQRITVRRSTVQTPRTAAEAALGSGQYQAVCVCVCVCVVAMPGQCMPATHTQTYVRHRSTAQHCTASPCYISGTPVHHGAAQSQYQQHLSPSTSITRQGRGTGPRPSPSRQQNTKSIRGLYVSSILAALSVTLKRITRANSALVICAKN